MSSDPIRVGVTPNQIAESIIASAHIAGMAVRLARLRCPDATITLRHKAVRGGVRDVLTVTETDTESGHARLGDLIYDLHQEPFNLDGERDGARKIHVNL